MSRARSESYTPTLRRVVRRVLPYGQLIELVVDVAGWWVGLVGLLVVRLGFAGLEPQTDGLLYILPAAGLIQVASGLIFGLYRGRWQYGSFEEAAAVARSVVFASPFIVLFDGLVHVGSELPVPLSVAVGAAVPALVVMAAARYLWRLALDSLRRPHTETATNMLVFGAGEAGAQIVRAMLRDPRSPYVPVALLDDDPRKRNLQIMTVPVVGGREQIADAAEKFEAEALLIAVASGSSTLLQELDRLGTQAGLDVKVVPSVGELVSGTFDVTDIRDVTVEDLLGRTEVETDVQAIAGYLAGRRVLVTGAGGSIGSELCRQIVRWSPAELVMLDRDESGLVATELSLIECKPSTVVRFALIDIRDEKRLDQEFQRRRPEVVFHAAALKHAPLLEENPAEALKTNVRGTATVLRSSVASGVDRFVNISSDKAAGPQNVLGYSKRIAERLTSWYAQDQPGTYLSVRFGNVLGSRGSVLDTFRSQIRAGGPVTVTDPEVSRYFMTISEAVQLVMQAGAIGSNSEVLVLDMGPPVRILDLARRLVSKSDHPVEIVFTGLRPGDNLHERLFADDECGVRRVHPLISHVYAPPLPPSAVLDIDQEDPFVADALRRASGDTTDDASWE